LGAFSGAPTILLILFQEQALLFLKLFVSDDALLA
jgi:hypothetical protein